MSEDLFDVVLNMARPYGARVGFSDEATAEYAREKWAQRPTLPGRQLAQWVKDNICTALLNEVI